MKKEFFKNFLKTYQGKSILGRLYIGEGYVAPR